MKSKIKDCLRSLSKRGEKTVVFVLKIHQVKVNLTPEKKTESEKSNQLN